MSLPSTLPPVVQEKLTGLASRLRFARLMRGSSVCVLFGLSLLAVLFVGEFTIGFSSDNLRLLFVGFVALGAVAVLLLVVFPLWQKPRLDALAAVIEDNYPELEERLLSSVELCAANAPHESPELVTALLQETSAKTESIDIRQVISLDREKRVVRFTGVCLLVAVVAASLWPALGGFSQRFFSAWFASPPRALHVTACPVGPLKLVDVAVTISPPEYTHPKVHPIRNLKNPDSALSVFEFSRVRFDLQFNRPAVVGQLILKDVCQLPLRFTEENGGAFVELPAIAPGEYDFTVQVEGQDKFPANHVLPRLRITRDEPPVFSSLQVPGTEIVADAMKVEARKAREITPDDVLVFNFIAEDRVGLDSVVIEFRINDSAVRREVIVEAKGETKVAREFEFTLTGRVKDGDLLLYRLKAIDNRRVAKGRFTDPEGRPTPPNDLEAQQVFAPSADKWYVVRIKLNEELAESRLDLSKLAELGRKQEELGKQAAQTDSKTLSAEQDRLAQEFKRLLEQSKLFEKSMNVLREMEAQRLAKDAHQLARRQRELTNQAADNLRRELMQKLAPLAEKQRELAMQAGKLAEESARSLQANGTPRYQSTEAMKAAEALRQAQVGEALAQQKNSSDELARLAKDLENAINLSRSPREAARQLARRQQEIQRSLEELARDFARLPADQLRRSLQDLTKAQQALQQAIKKLPVASKPGDGPSLRQRAQELAGQAAESIEPDAFSAFSKMGEVRAALEQLAEKLPSAPETATKDSAADLVQRKQAQTARQLSKEQQNLRSAVEKAIKDVMGSPAIAQDNAKQKKLMAEAAQLTKELMELSQNTKSSDEAKEKANDAAQSAQQAQQSMKQSQDAAKQGNAEQGSQAGQQAAQELDQAGVDAALAAQMLAKQKPGHSANQTASELRQSRQAMQQAQQQLKQGQTSEAGKSMQQAGQAMRRAAKQASPQGINSYVDQKMTQEGELLVGPNAYRPEPRSEPGRAWGELSGELRTRILQDLRTRYGEDYGAIIQHYFQQIADVPMRKK